MGFVYRVVRVLKAPQIVWSETINFLKKKKMHKTMYIVPSSGHISLIFNLPFKMIIRRFEVVFCLE